MNKGCDPRDKGRERATPLHPFNLYKIKDKHKKLFFLIFIMIIFYFWE